MAGSADEKMRLLIADDDGPFRSLAAIVVRGAGYAVVEARDGTEALAKARAEDFELILLDIRMPGYSGWEILRALIADASPERPPSRVLMMTGLTTEFDLDRLKKEGAYGMLIKPFQNDDLLSEVKRILALPRVKMISKGVKAGPAPDES
jgi:two-component system, chemotaxis family, chemotaxis protein CheY